MLLSLSSDLTMDHNSTLLNFGDSVRTWGFSTLWVAHTIFSRMARLHEESEPSNSSSRSQNLRSSSRKLSRHIKIFALLFMLQPGVSPDGPPPTNSCTHVCYTTSISPTRHISFLNRGCEGDRRFGKALTSGTEPRYNISSSWSSSSRHICAQSR